MFCSRGKTPYNWSATYWDDANNLYVKGSWRVDNTEVQVQCRISRGTESRFGEMSILE